MRSLEPQATPTTTTPLPPALEAALIDLLAQVLVAELVEAANPATPLAAPPTTDESPPGLDRTDRQALDPAA